MIGWDFLGESPIAAEPSAGSGRPAPMTMEWTNDTSLTVQTEPGIPEFEED